MPKKKISPVDFRKPPVGRDRTTQAPRYRTAFSRLVEEIRAVPDDDLSAVNLDVMAIVRTTEGVLPKIAPQRPLIVELLPKFDIQVFDTLEDHALALGHTQTVYEQSLEPLPTMQPLADEATAIREILLSEVTTLIKRELIAPAAVSHLKGANGYKNLSSDLFSLSEVFRGNWDRVSARTAIKLEELDAAENLADKINKAIGLREQSPELQASAARDRQAAYTLCLEAYNEVRAAIAYVRRKQDDVDSIMPSLYAGRGNGKKKPAADEGQNPPAPAPVDAHAADNHEAPVVTPAVVAPAVVTPVVAASNSTEASKSPTVATANRGPFVQ
jgi:hypothetical protein